MPTSNKSSTFILELTLTVTKLNVCYNFTNSKGTACSRKNPTFGVWVLKKNQNINKTQFRGQFERKVSISCLKHPLSIDLEKSRAIKTVFVDRGPTHSLSFNRASTVLCLVYCIYRLPGDLHKCSVRVCDATPLIKLGCCLIARSSSFAIHNRAFFGRKLLKCHNF